MTENFDICPRCGHERITVFDRSTMQADHYCNWCMTMTPSDGIQRATTDPSPTTLMSVPNVDPMQPMKGDKGVSLQVMVAVLILVWTTAFLLGLAVGLAYAAAG